jgi:hypothetical protein
VSHYKFSGGAVTAQKILPIYLEVYLPLVTWLVSDKHLFTSLTASRWIRAEMLPRYALETQLRIFGGREHRMFISGLRGLIMLATRSRRNGCRVHVFSAGESPQKWLLIAYLANTKLSATAVDLTLASKMAR